MLGAGSSALSELSARQAVAAMRMGELRAETYAEALLARCTAGEVLNAFITLEPEQVLEAARAADVLRAAGGSLGLLHGLPIPIKDSVNTKGMVTTAGTPALRGFRPEADAPVVAALRAAGAFVLGKTNLHELSFGWTSDNLAFGAVRNPYDTRRIAGGSSGGTAAAVAARMAPLGLAEDTQGSIRVPAALCGICGLRPTTGRYPSSGVAPITALFDQVGAHARSVDDLVLFDAVVTGDTAPVQPAPLAGLRLGIPREYYFAGIDERVELVVNAALARLRDAGVELVDVQAPRLDELVGLITGTVQLHDVVPALTDYLIASGANVGFAQLLAMASRDVQSDLMSYAVPGARYGVTEHAYLAARDRHLPALRKMFAELFARNDVAAIVFPTTMVAATTIGDAETVLVRGKRIPFPTAIARNIAPGSTAGLPGLVLPVGLTRKGGLPVSLELDAPAGADRALLSIGLAIEQVLGPMAAPPAVWK